MDEKSTNAYYDQSIIIDFPVSEYSEEIMKLLEEDSDKQDDVRYLLHLAMLEVDAKCLFLDGFLSEEQYDKVLRRYGGTP